MLKYTTFISISSLQWTILIILIRNSMKNIPLFSLACASAIYSAQAIQQCGGSFQARCEDLQKDISPCEGPTNCLSSSTFCGLTPRNCIYTAGCADKPKYLVAQDYDKSQSVYTSIYSTGLFVEIATYPGPYSATYPNAPIHHYPVLGTT